MSPVCRALILFLECHRCLLDTVLGCPHCLLYPGYILEYVGVDPRYQSFATSHSPAEQMMKNGLKLDSIDTVLVASVKYLRICIR
jgi:hypothetical protein